MASTFMRWIRTPAARDYFMSTHFWGPAANWTLPLAALTDLVHKDEEFISGPMTTALACYSLVFMRFAWRVQPRNYLLLACHITNSSTQILNDARFVRYWYMGGRERRIAQDLANKKNGTDTISTEPEQRTTEKVLQSVEKAKTNTSK